jgi:hypothetical protein
MSPMASRCCGTSPGNCVDTGVSPCRTRKVWLQLGVTHTTPLDVWNSCSASWQRTSIRPHGHELRQESQHSTVDLECRIFLCADNQCNPVGANSCCKVAATLAKGTRVRAICYVPGEYVLYTWTVDLCCLDLSRVMMLSDC